MKLQTKPKHPQVAYTQAKAAASQEELIQSAKMAKESSTTAFFVAERALYSYFLIKGELEHPICGEMPEQSPPVANNGSRTDHSPEVPKVEGGKMQENEAMTLKQSLVELMKVLYDQIPERVLNAFLNSRICSFGGSSNYIQIDALELPGEETRLIAKEDCDSLSSEIPGK